MATLTLPLLVIGDPNDSELRDVIESLNATSAELTSVDVMPAGDGLVEIGRATLMAAPQGQPAAQMDVKYVVYWRQEDGRWKWHVDIWNSNA